MNFIKKFLKNCRIRAAIADLKREHKRCKALSYGSTGSFDLGEAKQYEEAILDFYLLIKDKSICSLIDEYETYLDWSIEKKSNSLRDLKSYHYWHGKEYAIKQIIITLKLLR